MRESVRDERVAAVAFANALLRAEAPRVLTEEAGAVVSLLDAYRAATESQDVRILVVPHRAMREEPEVRPYLEMGAEVVAVGAVAGVLQPEWHDDFARTLVQAAFGVDDLSHRVRQDILGRPLPKPREFPELMAMIRQWWGLACATSLRGSLARAAAAYKQNRIETVVAGISSLEPRTGCEGDRIRIRGTFPPTQGRWLVLFPVGEGDTGLADVGHWSPKGDEIEIVAPPNVGCGYVGFGVPAGTGEPPLLGSVNAAATVMEECIGAGAGQAFGRAFSRPIISAPTALPGSENYFCGGIPRIRSFIGGTHSSVVHLTPNSALTLSWRVRNADRLEIAVLPSTPPHELPGVPAPASPFDGSITIPSIPGTRNWIGEYELRAWNRCTPQHAPVKARVTIRMVRRIGISLSGGGARGSFQVGALRYLYDVHGVRPAVIAGSSVGAINGAKLAEGDDPGGDHAQKRLEAIWRQMESETDMFRPEGWVLSLAKNELIEAILEDATDLYNDRSVCTPKIPAWGRVFEVLVSRGVVAVPEIIDALGQALDARSILNLSPIGFLLSDPSKFDSGRVASSGIELRLCVVGLESGETKYVTEHRRLQNRLFEEGTVDLRAAILASAAIPVVFPPQRLLNEDFVDGGIREILPLRAVVERGCNEIYAIDASGRIQRAPCSFGNATMATISGRAIDAMLDEMKIDDVASVGSPEGVKIWEIRPTVQIHDLMEIDRGLIDIEMDNGWMRAADVLAPSTLAPGEAKRLADRIVLARHRAWQLEYAVHDWPPYVPHQSIRPPAPRGTGGMYPDPVALDDLRNVKRHIHRLCEQRLQLKAAMPPHYERWWRAWELHHSALSFFSASPWAEFPSWLGHRAEATPPA